MTRVLAIGKPNYPGRITGIKEICCDIVDYEGALVSNLNNYDLILLDKVGKDWTDDDTKLVDLLRVRNSNRKNLYVFVWDPDGNTDVIFHAARAGANGWISAPLTRRDIEEIIGRNNESEDGGLYLDDFYKERPLSY